MAGEGFVEGWMAVWFRGADFKGGWCGWEKEAGFVEKLRYLLGKRGTYCLCTLFDEHSLFNFCHKSSCHRRESF